MISWDASFSIGSYIYKIIVLLDKLVYMGFSDNSISWFKSYLSNRSFIVNVLVI